MVGQRGPTLIPQQNQQKKSMRIVLDEKKAAETLWNSAFRGRHRKIQKAFHLHHLLLTPEGSLGRNPLRGTSLHREKRAGEPPPALPQCISAASAPEHALVLTNADPSPWSQLGPHQGVSSLGPEKPLLCIKHSGSRHDALKRPEPGSTAVL